MTDTFAQRSIIAAGEHLDRLDKQSVHQKIAQDQVKSSLKKLRSRYPNCLLTMQNVISYLKETQKNIQNFSTSDEDKGINSECIEDESNSETILFYNEISQNNQARNQKLKIIHELIVYFQKLESRLEDTLPLTFFAACDDDICNPELSKTARLELFFMTIHERRGTCQPHTIGVEGLQHIHPDVPKMLDQAALLQILKVCYDEEMRKVLGEKTLQQQLIIIKEWSENLDNGLSALQNDKESNELVDAIFYNFKSRGYKSQLLGANPRDFIRPFLYALPPFLSQLVNFYCSEYEKNPNLSVENVWKANEVDKTLEEHMASISVDLNEPLEYFLQSQLQLNLSEEFTPLQDEDYKLIIVEGKKEAIIWHKTPNLLTDSAQEFLISKVVSRLQEINTGIEPHTLHIKFLEALKNSSLKSNAIFQYIVILAKNREQNKELIAELIERLSDSNETRGFILFDQYRKLLKKAPGSIEGLQLDLIIRAYFASKNIDINACYNAAKWIKKTKHEKLATLLPFDDQIRLFQKSPMDYIFDHPNMYNALFLGLAVFTGIIVGGALLVTIFSSINIFVGIAVVLVATLASAIVALTLPLIILHNTLPYLKAFKLLTPDKAPHQKINDFKAALAPVSHLTQSITQLFHSYSSHKEMLTDLNTPVSGVVKLYTGCIGLIWGVAHVFNLGVKQTSLNISYCSLQVATGAIMLLAFPLVYAVKIPVRALLTNITGIISLFSPSKEVKEKKKNLLKVIDKINSLDEKKSLTIKREAQFSAAKTLHNGLKSLPTLKNKDRAQVKGDWATFKETFFYSHDKSSLEHYSAQVRAVVKATP